ncbi:Chlorovirus glycoprotein repeat domain-containing protein, partial [Paramecium bursaria Chlorella virus CZ-2]
MSYFLTPWASHFDEINASGNIITEQYFIGNGAFLTGATFTPPAVSSSDIRGNVIGSYANVTNIIASTGNIANIRFAADGNVTASYFFGNGSQLTGVTSTLPSVANIDIRGNVIGSYANVTNIIASTGNIANVRFAADGNVTAAYFFGNGSQLTGVTSTLPSVANIDIRGNVIGSYANVTNIIASTGNIANVRFAADGNVTAAYFFGNGSQLTGVTSTLPSVANIDTRGNVIGSYANVTNIIASTGNIANVRFAADGNVTAAYFFGNGSQLTGVTSTLPSVANIDIRGTSYWIIRQRYQHHRIH